MYVAGESAVSAWILREMTATVTSDVNDLLDQSALRPRIVISDVLVVNRKLLELLRRKKDPAFIRSELDVFLLSMDLFGIL